jgi:hypothetical protein
MSSQESSERVSNSQDTSMDDGGDEAVEGGEAELEEGQFEK